MAAIPLRIAEPTGRYRRSLRRFTFSDRTAVACADRWGHDASADIGDVGQAEAEKTIGDNWPHHDARWPVTCVKCGYQFADGDEWQRRDSAIYVLPDGTEFTFRGSFGQAAPAGAMVRAEWYDEHAAAFGNPGGESWLIALPDGGEWITTQKATGGGHWTVTGAPPLITVQPSIWHNAPKGWHGWIRNGELVDA